MMMALWREMVGASISGTLENEDGETMEPVGVAVKGGWGDFCRGGVKIIGQGIGDDSSVMD